MSGATFRSSEPPEMESNEQSSFDQLLTFDGWLEDDDPILMALDHPHSQSYAPLEIRAATNGPNSLREGPSCSSTHTRSFICSHSISKEDENGRVNKDVKERFAFKTKSDVEILDDGFKWRKYGKKMVKNSPNPRNYYKCAVAGCYVKKRVERDREDPSFVITTYEGFHNHHSPLT